MSPNHSYAWRPIEHWDLKWHRTYLPEVFNEFRRDLTNDVWSVFNERCAREWSIETGVIENAFSLERGITIQLIKEGFISSLIDRQPNGLSGEQVAAILSDTKEALEGIFAFVKSEQALTTSYIRQLHQQLMKSVETYDRYWPDPVSRRPVLSKKMLERGGYKTEPNNPWRPDGSVHEYCPPWQVDGQMNELVRLYGEMDAAEMPVEVRAAWLHHSFAQIHPFQDGNGRVARAPASMVLIKGGLPPLIVSRYMKSRYIRSLESADARDYAPLVDFFESCLYRQIVSYWREIRLDSNVHVSGESSLAEILKAAEGRLIEKRKLSRLEWIQADHHLVSLGRLANGILSSIAGEITTTLQRIDSTYAAFVFSGAISAPDLTVSSIERWDEKPPPNGYKLELSGITIKTSLEEKIFVVYDPLSAVRKGLCGVAVVLDLGEAVYPVEPSFFFNFAEPYPEERFAEWLSAALNKAILEWQKRIA